MPSSVSIDAHTDFREAVTPDLYDTDRFVDWQYIDVQLGEYVQALDYLDGLRDRVDAQAILTGLSHHPHFYRVLTLLLSVEHAVGFGDGRELPDPNEPLSVNPDELARLLVDLGVGNLIQSKSEMESAIRSALIARDARRRRYRVEKTLDKRIEGILRQAIEKAGSATGLLIRELPSSEWPLVAKGRIEFLLATGDRPFTAIATVFQTVSGGRQIRDLSQSYPALRTQLLNEGIDLILIADGRGLRDAPTHILDKLFNGIPSCFTLKQAVQGGLQRRIIEMARREPPKAQGGALNELIDRLLEAQGIAHADDLPVSIDRARLALAEFATKHADLALQLDPMGNDLALQRVGLFRHVDELTRNFSPNRALINFAEVIGADLSEGINETDRYSSVVLALGTSDSVLPSRLLAVASHQVLDIAIVREVASKALAAAPEARMCVLLCLDQVSQMMADTMKVQQATLAVNVVILTAQNLLQMTKASQTPRAQLTSHLLEQSDLVKASPFVINSVTPERMFHGRAAEVASMVSALAANSVALLGGRRIGKTSLMRHAEKQLTAAGFSPYFGDCQTVRTWDDFASLARRRWEVTLPIPFHPSSLGDIVVQLRSQRNGKVVFLLDEIDQLLDWDKSHSRDEVPEAFFRACRALSQEGEAQFVFSGERTIAARIWDPHSPHWNFCQPLMLRQLDREAAATLIVRPLTDLQVSIRDADRFVSTVWSRTGGHPQLIQTLGDGLIRLLNDRESGSRASLDLADLVTITDTFAFAEHYLQTYWGQSTSLERLISLLVAGNVQTLAGIREFLQRRGISVSDDQVSGAFRMLELYGITEPEGDGYRLRLHWFVNATTFYGGLEAVTTNYMEETRG